MIHQISLQDCLEPSSPPDKVLTVSALDDTVFVRICTVEQDAHHETHTEVADISVSLPSLLEALTLLSADGEREHLRPVDHDGKSRETRIAGHRLAVVPLGLHSAVAAGTVHHRHSPPPGTRPDHECEETAHA